MNPSNNLKIRIDPQDYRLGDGRIKGAAASLVPSGNWLPFFEFFERQMLNSGDTDGCVCFSTQQSFDAIVEAQMALGMIPQPTIDLFNQLGYMDTASNDGKAHFHSSPRWIEILTGNGLNGNSVQDGVNVLRTYGPLPYKDLPVDPTMTPSEYVNPSAITQAMRNKAAQLLAAIGGKSAISFQWICDGKENWQAMGDALPNAPLLLGVNVGNDWNLSAPQPPATGANPGHCVSGIQVIQPNDMKIFDHYEPNPKDLITFPIWYALQMTLNILPPPPAPLPPTQPISIATIPLWQKWLSALQNWLESISPEGRAKLGGASRSSKWPEFKKEFAKTHLPVCAVCGGVKGLNAHHLRPFHAFPELELVESNVIWLCNDKECHIRVGHLGNFQSINPNGAEDIKAWRDKIRTRPMTVEEIKRSFNDN